MCQLDQHASSARKPGGFSSGDLKEIRNVIRKKYAEVSVSADGKFQYPIGRDGAIALGYDPAIMQKAGPRLLESFCGVGNPFSLGEIRPGDVVLDFGCGGGFDLFVAGSLVGESGRACGIDLTEEMVKRAEDNIGGADITNIEIRKVDSENVPYADHTFDVVISNGVINLSPDKSACFSEIYRALKPGGRIQFADVVLESKLPADLSGSLEAWSQ